MKSIRIAVISATALLLGAAGAGEQEHSIAISLADDAGETHVTLNSEELGFDLDEMQVGESRSIVNEQGQNILITREEHGFKMDVDGKVIDLPALHGEHGAVFVTADSEGHDSDVDVQVFNTTSVATAVSEAGIMIISDAEIDEATQDGIKTLLMSSGYDADVKFINPTGGHSGHAVKVIRKEVEVTR